MHVYDCMCMQCYVCFGALLAMHLLIIIIIIIIIIVVWLQVVINGEHL